MPTKALIPQVDTKIEESVAIKQMGRFRIFRFSSEFTSDEIIEAMQKKNAKPCHKKDLDTFNEAFRWGKGQLVALGGKFYGGPMYVCYTPVLINGKVDLLENIYGDRGKWDIEFYFLAK